MPDGINPSHKEQTMKSKFAKLPMIAVSDTLVRQPR